MHRADSRDMRAGQSLPGGAGLLGHLVLGGGERAWSQEGGDWKHLPSWPAKQLDHPQILI